MNEEGFGQIFPLKEIYSVYRVVFGAGRPPAVIVFNSKSVAVRSDTESGYYMCRQKYGVWSCSCPAFVASGAAGACKHLVAARIAVARETELDMSAEPRSITDML